MKKYTDAIVEYYNKNEKQIIFCTNRTLSQTLKKLNRCSWITNINAIYYNDGVRLEG